MTNPAHMYRDVYRLVCKYEQIIKDHRKCKMKEVTVNKEGHDPEEIETIQETEDNFLNSLIVSLRKIQENNAFIKRKEVMLK